MNLKKGLVFLLVVFCLTGCKGDDIRAFRSEGYTLATNEFKCNLINQKVRFLTNNVFVLENGSIYDISLDLIYQNKNNCKLIDKNIKVESIYGDELFKADNGQIYSFVHNNGEGYQISNENRIANILLGDNEIIKVINDNDNYYVLKSDGNIYNYLFDGNYNISNVSLMFDHNKYDGSIIDFNYSNNLDTIFVKTNNTYYRNQIKNPECKKYADVDCQYEIKEDKYLNKYKDEILGYNGKTLILKSGKMLTHSS